PCAANKTLPTEGHCDAGMVFHIEKGAVDGVALDGLNWVMVIKSPQGKTVKDSMAKDELELASVYLDEKADEKQRAAFGKLLPALFGPKQMKNQKPPVFTAMKYEAKGDEMTFEIPGKMTMDVENIDVGTDTKHARKTAPGHTNRILLTNTAPFPFVTDTTQGFSKKFTYEDYGVKWDYKERNSFFGRISAKGKLAAEKKA